MSRQGASQERTLHNVKTFWNKEATEWGDNPQVTIRDHYFRLLSLRLICELLKGRNKALDLGMGTGFSTLFYSAQVKEIVGVDYAEAMVASARRFLDDSEYFAESMRRFAPDGAPAVGSNIRFEEGNIL